jgi:hypothetical protein
MRAAIYARVSTTGNGQSPEMQLRDFAEYAKRRGWTVVGEYVDVGISGAKDKRPELDRLMADAHKRRFDVIVVWRFDRFARSVSHLLRALETFQALGIEFVSLSEHMDTSTPTGKMVFTVLGAVAELERSLIVERVRAGMRNLIGAENAASESWQRSSTPLLRRFSAVRWRTKRWFPGLPQVADSSSRPNIFSRRIKPFRLIQVSSSGGSSNSIYTCKTSPSRATIS